jgi:hypothetical protein
MGADSIVAIAAGEGPSADRDASQTLLREWRPRAETPLLDASSVSPARLPSASIWLFDEAPWLRDLSPGLPDELSIEPKQFILGGRSYDRGKFTLAAALSHPAGGDLSMGLLLAPSPQAALEAGRKLTHYGRYGYLVFEGATNVAKGSWTPGRSPLLKVWDRN